MTTDSPALLASMRQVGVLLQTGEHARAHQQLLDVLAQQTDHVEALRLLGGLAQLSGDVEAAETWLRRALAADPNWAPTLLTLGELLLQRGRYPEAEPLLQCAAQRLPAAALLLARHYNDQHRPAEALAVIAPLCARGQAPAEAVTQHVAALSALGRPHEAVAFYRPMADGTSGTPQAEHALAIALSAADQHLDAERAARRALQRGLKTAAVHATHARSLIALGEFERAETALRDSLKLDPRQPETHSQLARLIWMRSGDAAQSTAELERALQAFPADESLRATQAAILQGAGQSRAAYACLAAATERAQASPALLVRAGLAALDFDAATAKTLSERALRMAPEHAAARSLLAAALLGLGEPALALQHCEALLAKAADDQYLIALQTTAWRLLGDPRYVSYCNYAQLVRPTSLHVPPDWPDLPRFLADLKRSLERLHNPNGHPLLFQSLRHGTETTADLSRHPDPVIQELFKAFDTPIRDYLSYIGTGIDPLRRRNRGGYRFHGGWSVRLRSAGYHTSHVHPRGWLSSAFYVDLPQHMADASGHGGYLAFGEPGIATLPPLPNQHLVQPEAGTLVLFPSYFWHGTVPFRSEQTRLTVAFDLIPP